MEIESLSQSRAWPAQEALRIIERISSHNKRTGKKKVAVFETGYGPSGLPHLGTIAEVVRTLMIKKAYDKLSDVPSILVAVVDDMDGLRKVPGNVPNKEMLTENLEKPLFQVPDPYGEFDSFATQNAHRFETLLNSVGYKTKCITDPNAADAFEGSDSILILRASTAYKSGLYNRALVDMLKHHKGVLEIMKEHLRSERFSTYSHFMPISPVTGKVLQVPMKEYKASTIVFEAEDGTNHEMYVIDGTCKLQWKPDLGMRWHALGVDCELYGKDLDSTVEVAQQICRLLGSEPPLGFQYEHFLAEDGGKVSKSKGNETVSLNHWLKYTPVGALEHFLFQSPRRAKRMSMKDLPTYVEAFLNDLNSYDGSPDSPINYIDHDIKPTTISYKLALSLACAMHVPSAEMLIEKMQIEDEYGKQVARTAFNFFETEIKANLKIEPVSADMQPYVAELVELLKASEHTATDLQDCFFEIAKKHSLPMGDWFKMLYRTLIGTEQGPKLGSFCMTYGLDNVIAKLS